MLTQSEKPVWTPDRTQPPSQRRYRGASQIERQIEEYKARFGVELEKIDGFETVREVELARHCCLHNEGRLTEDYETQTKQRLIGEWGDIDMTPETRDLLIRELSAFADGLYTQLREIRKQHRL